MQGKPDRAETFSSYFIVGYCARFHASLRDATYICSAHPALKRRAIISGPSGTKQTTAGRRKHSRKTGQKNRAEPGRSAVTLSLGTAHGFRCPSGTLRLPTDETFSLGAWLLAGYRVPHPLRKARRMGHPAHRAASALFPVNYFKVTSRASVVLSVGDISLRFFAASAMACRLL